MFLSWNWSFCVCPKNFDQSPPQWNTECILRAYDFIKDHAWWSNTQGRMLFFSTWNKIFIEIILDWIRLKKKEMVFGFTANAASIRQKLSDFVIRFYLRLYSDSQRKDKKTLWWSYSLIKYLWLAAMCVERSTLMHIYVNTSRHPGTQRFLLCQLRFLWPQLLQTIFTENPRLAKFNFVPWTRQGWIFI